MGETGEIQTQNSVFASPEHLSCLMIVRFSQCYYLFDCLIQHRIYVNKTLSVTEDAEKLLFFFFSCSGTPAFNGLVPKINSFCSWQRPPAWHRNSTFASVSEKLFTVSIRCLEPSGLTLDYINANGRKLFTAKYKSSWWTLKCYLIFNIYIFSESVEADHCGGLLKNVKTSIWSRFMYFLLPVMFTVMKAIIFSCHVLVFHWCLW